MLLLAAIPIGIICGLIVMFALSKQTQEQIVASGDHQLLNYHIPALLFLLGTRFLLSPQSIRVTTFMALAMFIAFFIGLFIATRILKISGEMRNGFLVLSSCTNTGHGVMLLAASTTASGILGLAMGPMYIGFLCVIFLPMFLVDRAKVPYFTRNMILWHPVSYYTLSGVLFSQSLLLAFLWISMIGIRMHLVRKDENAMNSAPKPYFLIWALLVLTLLFGHTSSYSLVAKWFPIFMVWLTCLTVGIKMGAPMKMSHWKIVLWVNIFGIVIAPSVGLIIAKIFSCSYEEAYVLTYSLSQPPAYLGMLWLRQGKFGKDFAISEWAFVIQALLAYVWAIFAPSFLKIFF